MRTAACRDRVFSSKFVRVLLRRARCLTRSESDAWDLVQETFVRAFERPPQDYQVGRYGAWLKVVLKNLHLDQVRSAAWRASAGSHPELMDSLVAPAPTETPVWKTIDPECLEAGLKRLRPIDRNILLMQTRDCSSLKEIGRTLNIGPATVATRAHRARARLRRIILQDLNHVAPPARRRARAVRR